MDDSENTWKKQLLGVSVTGTFRFSPAKRCSSMRKVVASGYLGKNAYFKTHGKTVIKSFVQVVGVFLFNVVIFLKA